jgi:hypothetical protein
MKRDLCHAFAELTAHLEDLYGIAVEGQHRDTSYDMHHVLVIQLRSGLAMLDGKLSGMAAMIDRRAR